MRIAKTAANAFWSLPLVLNVIAAAHAGDIEIRGRVVDEAGGPVADAAIDYFWRANGSGRGSDGKFLDMKVEANIKLFWANVGKMEPMHPEVKTGLDGRFSLKLNEIYHGVMAMDQSRQRGTLRASQGVRGSPNRDPYRAPGQGSGEVRGPSSGPVSRVDSRLHLGATRPDASASYGPAR